jgi:molecular chaperone DnaJ
MPHGFSNVSDIFDAFSDIFSGFGLGDLFGGGRGGRTSRGRRGEAIEVELTVTLEDVLKGRDVELDVERLETCETCKGDGAAPGSERVACRTCGGQGAVIMRQGFFSMRQTCPDCHGEGFRVEKPCSKCRGRGRALKKRAIEVKLPKGLPQNAQMRLRGEGHHGTHGGPPGDVSIILHEEDHELFTRDGDELLLDLPISYPQAVLGAKIEVPTLDGTARLDIPKGTPTGKVFTIHGQGLPRYQRSGRGHLLVRTHVDVPKRISSEEETLLRRLAELHREEVSRKPKGLFAKVREIFE